MAPYIPKDPGQFWKASQRIAKRMSPRVAAAYMAEIERIQKGIDMAALRASLASGRSVEKAIGLDTLGLVAESKLERGLIRIGQMTGQASAAALSDAMGFDISFNATHPRVIIWAREQAANLVVGIGESARETIRIVVSEAFRLGLTIDQQARIIREVVGLPPNWAAAPLNLAEDLRNGIESAAADRRLSGVDKQRIRSAIRNDTVTEDFIAEMEDNYTGSLTNLRARTIARTETLRVANHGTIESWRQAIDEGDLPDTARKVVIVTPDDRLRETHLQIAEEYQDGIPVDDNFETPWGEFEGPPFEVNCRCSVGLIFPGRGGVL